MQAKELTCPECGTKICFQCREEAHGKLTCEEALEKKFKCLGSNQNIGFCPLCRTKMEKTAGCNMMTCLFCGYKFCWICKQQADYDHFSNPLSPCGGRLMEEDIVASAMKKYLWMAFALTVGPLLLLVLFFPILMIAETYKAFVKAQNTKCVAVCLTILASPFVFVFAFICNICVVPVLLIVGLVMAIKWLTTS